MEPNPKSCADGSCTDPSFPFCDVDGSIGGKAGTCLAVTCMPDEVVGCRGDTAIKCNGTGNNYDLVECAFGCNASTKTCSTCAANDHCDASLPVCDQEDKTCRWCAHDDECSSAVCDVIGSCLPESRILYAASGGSESSECVRAQPCSIARAIELARQQGKTVRLLPGAYVTPIELSVPNVTPIMIVGTGATITSFTGVSVMNGANVSIRGSRLPELTMPFSAGRQTRRSRKSGCTTPHSSPAPRRRT